jgi:hypothetical protein
VPLEAASWSLRYPIDEPPEGGATAARPCRAKAPVQVQDFGSVPCRILTSILYLLRRSHRDPTMCSPARVRSLVDESLGRDCRNRQTFAAARQSRGISFVYRPTSRPCALQLFIGLKWVWPPCFRQTGNGARPKKELPESRLEPLQRGPRAHVDLPCVGAGLTSCPVRIARSSCSFCSMDGRFFAAIALFCFPVNMGALSTGCVLTEKKHP